MTDMLSPDSKSAVIIKDNDLFYIASGDKELRRLTNDKTPEVNARFSPTAKRLPIQKTRICMFLI